MFMNVLRISAREFEEIDEREFRELSPLVEEHYKHFAAKTL
jgi:hypothetical protein